MVTLVVIETAVLLVLSVLVVGLLRAYATILNRLHEIDGGSVAASPPPFRTVSGVPAPDTKRIEGRDEWAAAHDIEGTNLNGDIVSIATVGVENDTVIAFLSSSCAGCVGFWDELSRPESWTLPPESRLIVVTKSAQDESVGMLDDLCPPTADLVMSSQAWADYSVPGSPFIAVVDGHTGRVKGEGSGMSFSQVSGLIAQNNRDQSHPSVNKPAADVEREEDVDRILLEAGIQPGDSSLYAESNNSGSTNYVGGNR